MRNPPSNKEKNLIKGAIRRVFSRSDLRRQALAAVRLSGYMNPNRPRVKKWSRCPICDKMTPEYLMEVDHKIPLVPLNMALEDMTWDEVVDRAWCNLSDLQAICKPCHKEKTKAEAKQRREFRKGRK